MRHTEPHSGIGLWLLRLVGAALSILIIVIAPHKTQAQRGMGRGGFGHFGGGGSGPRRAPGPRYGPYNGVRGYGWYWPVYGWGSSLGPYCDVDWDDCYGNPYSDVQATSEAPVPVLVLYLRDGSGYSVTDYWLTGGSLHFVTTYGAEKAVDLDQLDAQRTVDENSARGVYFTLGPSRTKPNNLLLQPQALSCDAMPSGQARLSAAQAGADNQPGLFGAAGGASALGLRVSIVQPGSAASRIGIQPGDVVTKIDCQRVYSRRDIDAAIAANGTGNIWVSYLIKSTWLKEQQVRMR